MGWARAPANRTGVPANRTGAPAADRHPATRTGAPVALVRQILASGVLGEDLGA